MSDSVESTIARLERELAELKATVRPEPDTTTRRGLLKAAGAGAAGAAVAGVTAVLAAQPAGAVPAFQLNEQNQNAGAFTEAYYSGATSGAAFLFQSGNAYNNGDASYPCALAGWATSAAAPHGVYAFTQVANAYALVAVGGSNGANILVYPSGPPGPARSGAHTAGELLADGAGDLWACVAGGSPGEWRKLAGSTTAGAFHAISPRRVYDSREGAGKLEPGAGGERTISVANATPGTGGGEVVPAGAVAVAITFTVTNTEGGGGFVSVRPAGTPYAGTSSINWFGPDQNIGTTVISAVGGDRQLTLQGGNAATDVVVDVTGYYR